MSDVMFPMDVVMVGPFPDDVTLIKGGVQASVYGLARALSEKPEVRKVQVISTPVKSTLHNKMREGVLDGIEVMYLNAPLGFMVSSAVHLPAIMRKVRALKKPVVHIHGTGLLETALCILLRLKRIPYVWTLHGITEKETRQRLRDRFSFGALMRYVLYTGLERFSLRIVPQVIVDTAYVKDEISRKDVHVIPQGIFTNEFTAIADIPRTEKLIACVGVIEPRKGHLQTIEAFALLHKAIPQARLVIAGALMDSAYLERMVQRVAELNMEGYITFAIGQPRAVILKWLARAQIFALHSREESQGIALCEALAAGLPIVATRVGGIPYVVTDGEDGILVDYGDVQGFAEGFKKLLADDALRLAMSAQARRSSVRFCWGTVATDVVNVYKAACA